MIFCKSSPDKINNSIFGSIRQYLPFVNWGVNGKKNNDKKSAPGFKENPAYNILIKQKSNFNKEEKLYQVKENTSFIGNQLKQKGNHEESSYLGKRKNFLPKHFVEYTTNNLTSSNKMKEIQEYIKLKFNLCLNSMIDKNNKLVFYTINDQTKKRINELPDNIKFSGHTMVNNWLAKMAIYFDLMMPEQFSIPLNTSIDALKYGNNKQYDQGLAILNEYSYSTNSTDFLYCLNKTYPNTIKVEYDDEVQEEKIDKVNQIVKICKTNDDIKKAIGKIQNLGLHCTITQEFDIKTYPFEISDSKIITHFKIENQRKPNRVKSIIINLCSPRIIKYVIKNFKTGEILDKNTNRKYRDVMESLKIHGLRTEENNNIFSVMYDINGSIWENKLSKGTQSLSVEGVGGKFRPVAINWNCIGGELITVKIIPTVKYSLFDQNIFNINLSSHLYSFIRFDVIWSPVDKNNWKIWNLQLRPKNITANISFKLAPGQGITVSFGNHNIFYNELKSAEKILLQNFYNKIIKGSKEIEDDKKLFKEYTKDLNKNQEKYREINDDHKKLYCLEEELGDLKMDKTSLNLSIHDLFKLIKSYTGFKIPGRLDLNTTLFKLVNHEQENIDRSDIYGNIRSNIYGQGIYNSSKQQVKEIIDNPKKGLVLSGKYSIKKKFNDKYSWWLNIKLHYGDLNNLYGASYFLSSTIPTNYQAEFGLQKDEKIISLDDLLRVKTGREVDLKLCPLMFLVIDPTYIFTDKDKVITDKDKVIKYGTLINLVFGMTLQLQIGRNNTIYIGIFCTLNYNSIMSIIQLVKSIYELISSFFKSENINDLKKSFKKEYYKSKDMVSYNFGQI
jgi:hypothetical protein